MALKDGVSRELAWLTPVDIATYLETDKRIILPFGATENNGPHLPLATDTVVAEAVAHLASARTGVLVSPTVSLGNSSVNMAFPGTIALRPPTCEAVITDVCRSLRVHGFEQIAIVTGHYGNVWPVANVAETVRDELGVTVVQLDVWRCVELTCRDLAVTRMFPFGHGGEMMTSILMHVAPEHVRADRIEVWEPRDGVELKYYRTYPGRMGYAAWNDVTASGAVGDVREASAERGEIAVQRVSDLLIELLEDLPSFGREDS